MAISNLPEPPSRATPATFSPLADAFIAALPVFVDEANATAQAMNLNDTTANSTTSVTIGYGSKSFIVDLSKSYQPGMSVKIAVTASPSNWMHGDITSYNAATGELIVNVTTTLGDGTFAAWTITLSAPGTANSGVNDDITAMTGLDDGGIPVVKVDGAAKKGLFGIGTFASDTGDTIDITALAIGTTSYHVDITPDISSGYIGEISVESKAENSFVVKNSGSDITTTFTWSLTL